MVLNLLNIGMNTGLEVINNRDTVILWDFNIRTNCVIEDRCPDILLINMENQETFIINASFLPREFHVRNKKAEKILYCNRMIVSTLHCIIKCRV